MDYIKQIEEFNALTEQEIQDKQLILRYIHDFPHTILTRENEYAHITSSSMIFNNDMDKVLMIYHNLYDSWSWTGGHADGDADLLHVAIKEAQEETGLISFIPLSNQIFTLDILPVWGHIKHGKYVSSHEHINTTYVLKADDQSPLRIKEDENSDVKWIPITGIETVVSESNMIPVYKKIINRVLLQ